jgi:hypothetical protein
VKGGLPALARANLYATAISHLGRSVDGTGFGAWIVELAFFCEETRTDEVVKLINEERSVAGFPEVTDLPAVEEDLAARRLFYRTAIKSGLNALAPAELIAAMTVAVDVTTEHGRRHAPLLIDDLVDSYELEIQGFLGKEEANIARVVETIQQAADAGRETAPLLERVGTIVRNWDRVAQPIQLSRESRGLRHDGSRTLATQLRDLALHLHNDHGYLEDALNITALIQQVFAEVAEVATWAAQDLATLQGLAEQREATARASRTASEQWAREITYEAEIGVVLKNRLKISPDGIEWRGQSWPLETISQVRWGGVSHSINGIPTGTEYKVHFQGAARAGSVTTRKEAIYLEFTSRLWRTVGVRLLTEMLGEFQQGKTLIFGPAAVDDRGARIPIHKFFSRNESIYSPWSDLLINNGPGYFQISSASNKNAHAELSYLDVDNVHILEWAIQALWKKGGPTLSSLLRGGS